MRILVCGGRDYDDMPEFTHQMGHLAREHGLENLVIIHGGASGADRMASNWAFTFGLTEEAYLADWKTHGRAAGPIRNRQMLVEGKPDLVLAFPGGKGTANMITQAEKAGVEVIRVESVATKGTP